MFHPQLPFMDHLPERLVQGLAVATPALHHCLSDNPPLRGCAMSAGGDPVVESDGNNSHTGVL